MRDKNDSLKKISFFSNLVFFFNKILFIILTNIKTDDVIYIWFMLIALFISTFANMIFYTKYNNYENRLLKELNKFFSVILFYLITCLIIGKIFNGWGFNGLLYLFLVGISSALINAILYKSKMNSFSFIDFKSINSDCESFIYIKEFLNLVKTKHLSREKTLLFDSLILIREENCIDENCKLKKYLKSKEKGKPNDFILFQYCQNLYEIALNKFPDSSILEINYSILNNSYEQKEIGRESFIYNEIIYPISIREKFFNFLLQEIH